MLSGTVLLTGGSVKAANGKYHPQNLWDGSHWNEGRLNQNKFLVWRPDYPIEGNWHQRHHVVWWLNGGRIPDWKNEREMIHHMNHDHFDDRFENLRIMTISEHSIYHNTKELVSYVCISCNRQFLLPKWRGEKKFCSQKCYHSYPRTEEHILNQSKGLKLAYSEGRR